MTWRLRLGRRLASLVCRLRGSHFPVQLGSVNTWCWRCRRDLCYDQGRARWMAL